MKFPRRVTWKGWLTIDRRHDDLDIVFFVPCLGIGRVGRKEEEEEGSIKRNLTWLKPKHLILFIYLFFKLQDELIR